MCNTVNQVIEKTNETLSSPARMRGRQGARRLRTQLDVARVVASVALVRFMSEDAGFDRQVFGIALDRYVDDTCCQQAKCFAVVGD